MRQVNVQQGTGVSQRGARIALLDELRGVTVLSMLAYHALWDIVYLFGVDLPWYRSIGGYVWQQSICWTFILLSGYCWPIGNHPVRRGLTIAIGGGLVSLATAIVMPEEAIFFGVLTLLSTCTLLWVVLDRFLRRVPPVAGLLFSAGLFFLTRNVNIGELGFEGLVIAPLPEGLYGGWLATCLGFPGPAFYSPDYFPLLPWMFLFAAGYFLHGLLKPERCRWSLHSRPLAYLGRNTLPIYMLHQPVIYSVCWLLLG